MKRLVAVGMLFLTGCSYTELNRAIMASNERREINFGKALAECKGEQGCLVGVSLAYGSNIGQQKLFKPETPLDYITAVTPLAMMLGQWYLGSSGGGGVSVKGDDNTVYFMAENAFTQSENYVQLLPTKTNTPTWTTHSNNPVTN